MQEALKPCGGLLPADAQKPAGGYALAADGVRMSLPLRAVPAVLATACHFVTRHPGTLRGAHAACCPAAYGPAGFHGLPPQVSFSGASMSFFSIATRSA